MQQGLGRRHLHHARCADRTDVAKACSTEIRGFFTRGAAVEKATKQNLHVEIPETKSTTATLKDHAEGGVRTALHRFAIPLGEYAVKERESQRMHPSWVLPGW
jgi:hypothetical protein